MSYRVRLTPEAESKRDSTVEYYLSRSPLGAVNWFDSFEAAIALLGTDPHRFPLSDESESLGEAVRQINFGTRPACPTHRMLFAVEDDVVIVYTLMSHSEDRWHGTT